jgi:hypothetical protein
MNRIVQFALMLVMGPAAVSAQNFNPPDVVRLESVRIVRDAPAVLIVTVVSSNKRYP